MRDELLQARVPLIFGANPTPSPSPTPNPNQAPVPFIFGAARGAVDAISVREI